MIEITTRRGITRLFGATTLGVLAGCTQDNGEEADEGNGEEADEGNGEEADEGDDEANGDDDVEANGDDDELTVSAVSDREATDEGEFYFDPGMVTVDVGETVRWEIEAEQHTVTAFHPDNQVPNRIPENADPFDSDTLAEDDTFEMEFEEEGVYDYFCRPHEHEGMVGTVVVGDPDPADQPGLEDPQGNGDVSEATVRELAVLNEQARSYLEDR